MYSAKLPVMLSKSEINEAYSYFENIDCTRNRSTVMVKRSVISPGPSKEWYKYIDNVVIIPYDVIITGDLNVQVDR